MVAIKRRRPQFFIKRKTTMNENELAEQNTAAVPEEQSVVVDDQPVVVTSQEPIIEEDVVKSPAQGNACENCGGSGLLSGGESLCGECEGSGVK